MDPTAVIFDMDGVLVDTEPLYKRNNAAVFARLGIRVDDEEYSHFVGTSAEKMWTALKTKHGLPHPVGDLIRMETYEQYKSLQQFRRLEPIPGVREFVRHLRAVPIRLGVASSSSRAVVDLTLEKAGFAGAFAAVVCGDEVTQGKPHPEIFLKTADLLGVVAGRCVVIEDSPRGVAGAKAAGMKTVGFENPNSGTHDLSGADTVIRDFSGPSRERILALLGK